MFCNNFFDFLMQSLIHATSISGMSGCDIAFIHDSIENEDSEKIYGRYNYFSELGFIIASLTSYFFINISIEMSLVTTSASSFMAFVMILFTKEISKFKDETVDNVANKKDEKFNFRQSFSDFKNIRYIFIFILSIAIINETSYVINTSLSQIRYQDIGIDIKYIGYIFTFSSLIGLLSSKVYILTNKYSQEKVLNALLYLMLSCLVVVIFTQNRILNILSISIIGGLSSIMYPIITDIKNKSIKDNRATMLSMYSMIGSFFTSILNIFMGVFTDINLKYAFIFCFIVVMLSIFGVNLYNKEEFKYNKEGLKYEKEN